MTATFRLALSVAFPAAALLAAPAFAQDAALQLVNDSGLTVMEVYAAPAGTADFGGDDILGAEVIPPGATGAVTVPGGAAQCAVDLLVVFEDGSERTDAADVCAAGSHTLTAG